MAQAGFTPISLYYSSTAAAVPTSGNLTNGELALNTADMKLYAKNSSGVVTLLASSSGATGTVSSVAMTVPSFLSVSGSPITTSGTLAVTLSGTALPVANGGTGQTSYTDGQLLIGNTTGNTLTKATLTAGSGISITNGSGSITIAATNSGTVTSVTASSPLASSGGATPNISLTGTVGISNGGTGQTTANAAFNALAPSQTSNSGKYLTTDGTNTSWATVSAGISQAKVTGINLIFSI